MVCGHTSCGGVNAALANQKLGLIDAWLMPLRSLRKRLARELEGLSPTERGLRMVEANVRQGVQTLKENADVIDAMRDRGVVVHGLVYDVACGELKELDIEEAEAEGKDRVEAFETSADGAKPKGKEDEKPKKEAAGVGGSEQVHKHEAVGGAAHGGIPKREIGNGSVGAVGGA